MEADSKTAKVLQPLGTEGKSLAGELQGRVMAALQTKKNIVIVVQPAGALSPSPKANAYGAIHKS